MAIFRYSFKKLLFSPSTYIILILTFIGLGTAWSIIGNILQNETNRDSGYPVWKQLSFSIFLSLLLFLFIAIKATQTFRDEIDDGTLLILLSKPVTRNQIWFEKCLSLQLTTMIYSFLSIFVPSLLILIPGISTVEVYRLLLKDFFILFGCSIIFQIIISSLALMISFVMSGKALVALIIIFGSLCNVGSTLIEAIVVGTDNNLMNYREFSNQVKSFQEITAKLAKQINGSQWLVDYYYLNDKLIPDNLNEYLNDLDQVIENDHPGSRYTSLWNKYEKDYMCAIANNKPTSDKDFNNKKYGLNNKIDIYQTAHFLIALTNSITYQDWLYSSIYASAISYSEGLHDIFFVKNNSQEKTISNSEYKIKTNAVTKFKVMKYLNIFYQIYYIWGRASIGNGVNDEPYIVHYKKINDDNYVVNLSASVSDFINYPALISAYLVVGLSSLGASWWLFKRRDFA